MPKYSDIFSGNLHVILIECSQWLKCLEEISVFNVRKAPGCLVADLVPEKHEEVTGNQKERPNFG